MAEQATPNPSLDAVAAQIDPALIWADKEKELIDLIFVLESDKQKLFEESKSKIRSLIDELQVSNAENEKLKKRVEHLEKELCQTALGGDSQPSKKEQEDVLLKAKTLLFEKTKVCKNQEIQMQALNVQIASYKDVISITKDMLNVRNMEVEHLNDRLETVDKRMKAQKDMQTLLEKKLMISQGIYTKLKEEYDIQSGIFKELRRGYGIKIDLLTNQLKDERQNSLETAKQRLAELDKLTADSENTKKSEESALPKNGVSEIKEQPTPVQLTQEKQQEQSPATQSNEPNTAQPEQTQCTQPEQPQAD